MGPYNFKRRYSFCFRTVQFQNPGPYTLHGTLGDKTILVTKLTREWWQPILLTVTVDFHLVDYDLFFCELISTISLKPEKSLLYLKSHESVKLDRFYISRLIIIFCSKLALLNNISINRYYNIVLSFLRSFSSVETHDCFWTLTCFELDCKVW